MKKFLKYINSMPFAFTMRHYQIFGESTSNMKDAELMSPQSWDALRKAHPFFSIPDTREAWLKTAEVEVKKDGQDKDLPQRARDIAALLTRGGIQKIFSVGSGGAALEYQIKKLLPDIEITCSDYSPSTVERLKKVFIEATDVIEFDILKGNWQEVQEKYIGLNGICLMYRIDASFSDAQWRDIFLRMHRAGVKRVLYIPTDMLTMLSVYNRKSREVKWYFQRIPKVFSGYVRTKNRFQKFWQLAYSKEAITLGGLKSFLLTLKDSS